MKLDKVVKPKLLYLFFLLGCCCLYSQEGLEIQQISFIGNKAISKSDLLDRMNLKTSNFITKKIRKKEVITYSDQLYQSDIKTLTSYYQKQGYLYVFFGKAEITISKKDKIKLHIPVHEGQPIRVSEINYTIEDSLPLYSFLTEKECKFISLKSEIQTTKIFTDTQFKADRELINDQFQNMGYAWSTTQYELKPDSSNKTIKINWKIYPGKLAYFGETTLNGNDRIPDHSIQRLLAYQDGDIWSKKALMQSQRRIYNLGMFRICSYKSLISNNQTDTIPTKINLKEGPRWSSRIGVGYGAEEKIRAFSELKYFGFITPTGHLNLYLKHSALEPYYSYLKFTQPAFLLPFNSMELYPYLKRVTEPAYALTKWGVNYTLLQNYLNNVNTSFSFYYEDVKLDDHWLIESSNSKSELNSYQKSGVLLGFNYSNADPEIDPLTGYSIAISSKINDFALTKDLPFYTTLLELKKYEGINRFLTVAIRFKMGFLKTFNKQTVIPPEELLYSGGSRSVRGWSRYALGPLDGNSIPLGGNSLLEGSIEPRIKLLKNLTLALFADWGNVWIPSYHFRINELRYAAGTGLRYHTPIGPVGIDIARPVFDTDQHWQFHLNIGHPF